MTEETYNGWTNRETWALNLWLTNDRGLYEATRERVRDAVEAYEPGEYGPPTAPDYYVGEAVRAFWDEITDPEEDLLPAKDIVSMLRDVGSEYRVNWDEIGAYWLSDLEGDPE